VGSANNKRVLLVILDGFGHTDKKEHNAIHIAHPKHWEEWLKKYPHSLIQTSGFAVGLPEGIMGNSEVGHLSIGSGRVIKQEFTRISDFSKNKGFETLPDVNRVLQSQVGRLHLIGLLSDGGVHSDLDHMFGLIDATIRAKVKRDVCIHVITDGRDTPPKSAAMYIQKLEKKIAGHNNIRICTVVGRYYAMDRDKRWDRVELAYKYLTASQAPCFTTGSEAIADAYANNETDEFVKPRQVCKVGRILPEDQVIFYNFRADRAREISEAFALPGFKDFPTPVKVKPENWLCFTQYKKEYPFPILFEKENHVNLLGELVSRAGGKQLRIAETEKYAHVTYFFNGGEEKKSDGENWVMIPSPKDVATYDLKPAMSAREVTEKLLTEMDQDYKLMVVNYANGDMVGHTGIEPAAVKAVEVLDECLAKVVAKALSKNMDVLITADHGNCEEMVNPTTGEPFTQHTTNPVPLVWIGPSAQNKKLKDGILADIAPTILGLLEIPKSKEMTGQNLIS